MKCVIAAVLLASLFGGNGYAEEQGADRSRRLAEMVRARPAGLANALFESLADSDLGVRQIALANLSMVADDPRLAPALLQQLQCCTSETRWLAARSVAAIPQAFVAIKERAMDLAHDPDPVVRRAFLANIAEGPGTQRIAEPILVSALGLSDPADRMAAAISMCRLDIRPPASLVDGLIQDLGAADPVKVGAASYVLTVFWDVVKTRVKSVLRTGGTRARVAAAELLRKHAVEFDPGALAGVFRSEDEISQLAACGTLARTGQPGAISLLAGALSSPSPRVRQAAVYALEALDSPPAVKVLEQSLGQRDANVRYRAAVVLGRLQSPASAAKLRSVSARDADPRVREAARFAAAIAAGDDLANVLPTVQDIVSKTSNTPPHKLALATGRPIATENGIVRVGSQKQLLVDNLTIESLGGASRVFHKFVKDPQNPIFEQQAPWEYQGVMNYCTTVDYDAVSRLFRMWYTSYLRAPDSKIERGGIATSRRTQLLAYSADGSNWVRPKLKPAGANNFVGATDNIVKLPDPYQGRYHFASYAPFREERRYSLAVSFSPDGITGWTDLQRIQPAGGDVITMARDDLGGGYWGFTKWRSSWWLGPSFGDSYDAGTRALLHVHGSGMRSFAPVWGSDPIQLRRGAVNILPTSADDAAAPAHVAAAYPGLDYFAPEDMHAEVYEVTPFVYEGIYFALPEVFYVSGRGGANDDGLMMLSLIFSRNAMGEGGWQRNGSAAVFNPVLDFGRWGEWDSTQIYGPNSLLVVDDRIVLYYTGFSNGHEPAGSRSDGAGRPYYRAAIGRATMRLDGMASLHAGSAEVQITTKPLVFEGDELEVNVAGELRVEVLDANGEQSGDTGRGSSISYRGDDVRHRVEWRKGNPVKDLRGRPVRLRFHIKNGDLYAYRFVETSARK